MNTFATQPHGSAFARFMASGYGRLARLVLGTVLIIVGLALVPWPAGLAAAAFGLVPLAAGIFNLCPIAPLWGGHLFGRDYCPATPRRRDSR